MIVLNGSVNSHGSSSSKNTVKWLEVPIQKFNAAVPHFVEIMKSHLSNITKLTKLKQWEEMRREHVCASRTVNQLTCLLSEMDNLRNQVVDHDLSKFDKLISSSKQSALSAIKRYQDIPIRPCPVTYTDDESQSTTINIQQDQKLQIVADLTEEIHQQERNAVSLQRVQQDVEDIHCLFQDLSQLVQHQGEDVAKIEGHVENTHQNILQGEKMLCQAAKYKSGVYPLIGAVIGSVVGGPVGLLAGFKLGGLTAVGCGFLGFTGGKILKNLNVDTINEAENHRQELLD